jgi:predicted NACHT family NTPase
LTDPDLNFLLDELRTIFHDYTGTHYALMNAEEFTPIKQKRFKKDYNIQFLPYTPSAPHHPEVEEFLKQLTTEVKKLKKITTPDIELKAPHVKQLAQEVKTWLEALRYEVTPHEYKDDRVMEMEAAMDQGTVTQRVLVRCIGDEIKASDVDALDELLTRKVPHGWLITDQRISTSAKERAAADDEAYRLFTLSDFLENMVWKNYFTALRKLVEDNNIHKRYVDIACYDQTTDIYGYEIARGSYESLDRYIDAWLKERGEVHISLLGEFGAGKTWFCRHYTYRQLERYLDDPVNQRLPLLIELRDFTKTLTTEQLVNDALLVKYKLPFMGNAYEVFQKMNWQGKLLLILDGFDEMARKVDYQTVVENFWELRKLVDDNSKVLLTSRTEYFRLATEPEKILGGEERGRKPINLPPPRFQVFHLKHLNNDQIKQVIINYIGEQEGEKIAQRILKNENLAEMTRKPILIELILTAMEEISSKILENQTQVYLNATNKLLLRNIERKSPFVSTADQLYFLCELAWEMISCQQFQIHYKDIPLRIKKYFGDKIKNDRHLDHWDFDLRCQTLLHRDEEGHFEFAHDSLADYFLAFKFSAELGCLSIEFLETYGEENERPCCIPYKIKKVEELSKTFGALPLSDSRFDVMKELFKGMLAKDSKDRLRKILHEIRGKTPEQVKYVGHNIGQILYDWMGSSRQDINRATGFRIV